MKFVLLLVVVLPLFFSTGCDDNEARGDGITGPGIDVHCFGAAPQPGNRDTNVRVTCPTGIEPP